MGNRISSFNKNYQEMLEEFELLQENPGEGIRYLEHRQTKKEYLLREISCHDKDAFLKIQETLENKKKHLEGNRHVSSLARIISNAEDQFCMSFYKLYALFQFPQRTLDDEINQRSVQKRRFQEKELWSILASCILGLSHLQKHNIKHTALRSSTVLISAEGVIQVYDPIATGYSGNYETLLNQRSTLHAYLSPQQVEALKQEKSSPQYQPFKSDIWAMGMIILEAGLLSYQDECYRDQYSRIHWETLQYNINLFQQHYSPQLTNLVEFMLSKDQRSRPDWFELEEHVIKVEEDVRGNGFVPQSGRKEGSGNRVDNLVERSFVVDRTSESPAFQFRTLENSKPQSFSRVGIARSRVQERVPAPTLPVKLSDISFSRPLKSIFPFNFYINKSQIDENMIYVPQVETHQTAPIAAALTSSVPNVNFSPIQNHFTNFSSNFTQSNQQQVNSSLPYHPDHHLNQFQLPPNYKPTFSNANESINLDASSRANPESVYVTELYRQGSKYQGYKLNGEKHGIGKFYYQDGGLYQGQWRHNKMQGVGKLFYQSNRLAYHGDWRNDQFSGRGTLYNEYPQPLSTTFDCRNFDEIEQFWTKYQGDFLQDMKHGWGVLYLSNGEYFQGQFKNDFAEGKGTFFTKNGTQVRGLWRCNLMQ